VIRVVIVDDHAMVREQVGGLLSRTPGLLVVGECGDGAEIVDVAAACQPDIVLMDVRMPQVNGVDATRLLTAADRHVRVIMFSGSVTPTTKEDAAAAGAVGYVTKNGDPQLLINAIRAVAAGGTAWP
jgi:DNA-binding NarL/FixJ family response regulator